MNNPSATSLNLCLTNIALITDIIRGIEDNVQKIRETVNRYPVIMAQNRQSLARSKEVLTRMQRRMDAWEQSCRARANNSTCDSLDDEIMPIPLATGEVPANFPLTRRELNDLTGPAVTALLKAYGFPVVRSVAMRRAHLSRVIGLPDLRAPL